MKGFIKFGTATISQDNVGDYWVSFIVHRKDDLPKCIDNSKIFESNSLGIDFGLKHFLTLSDGR